MPALSRKSVFIFSLLLIALTACSISASQPVELVNGTPVPVKKVLGGFYPIEGTHYQIAGIAPDRSESERGNGYDLSQLFSSGRLDYSVNNYVFLDVDSETVHALLPTNQNVILSVQGYPMPKANDIAKLPVAWWFYSIAKEDTNKDGRLSDSDKKTLSVSDVGGQGYTELIADVDGILGDAYKDGNVLVLIYRANDKNFLAHVDLLARKVTQTTELPSFGEDVK